MNLLGALLLGYLLGSIPFGLLLTRAAGLGDVRKIGSGNIGATNVLRTGNKGLAAATLLLDGLKGIFAVLICWWLFSRWSVAINAVPTTSEAVYRERLLDEQNIYLLSATAGLGAFLGHIFPVWLGFKGGKGVATFIGVVFALAWPLGLLFCLSWLVVALLSKYSSLAALIATGVAIIAAVLAPIYTPGHPRLDIIPTLPGSVKITLLLMALLLFYKHRDNIARLLAGTESRIGQKG